MLDWQVIAACLTSFVLGGGFLCSILKWVIDAWVSKALVRAFKDYDSEAALKFATKDSVAGLIPRIERLETQYDSGGHKK